MSHVNREMKGFVVDCGKLESSSSGVYEEVMAKILKCAEWVKMNVSYVLHVG